MKNTEFVSHISGTMKTARNLRKRLSGVLTQSSALLSACPNSVIDLKGAKDKGM